MQSVVEGSPGESLFGAHFANPGSHRRNLPPEIGEVRVNGIRNGSGGRSRNREQMLLDRGQLGGHGIDRVAALLLLLGQGVGSLPRMSGEARTGAADLLNASTGGSGDGGGSERALVRSTGRSIGAGGECGSRRRVSAMLGVRIAGRGLVVAIRGATCISRIGSGVGSTDGSNAGVDRSTLASTEGVGGRSGRRWSWRIRTTVCTRLFS